MDSNTLYFGGNLLLVLEHANFKHDGMLNTSGEGCIICVHVSDLSACSAGKAYSLLAVVPKVHLVRPVDIL